MSCQKCIVSNAGYAVWNCNICQAIAAERIVSNAGYAVAYGDFGEARAIEESIGADAGDAIANSNGG